MSGIQAIIPIASKGPNKNELTTVQAVRATNSRELRGGISNMPISAAMAAGMPNASAIFNAANRPTRRSRFHILATPLTTPHPVSAHGRARGGAAMEEKRDRAKLSPARVARPPMGRYTP